MAEVFDHGTFDLILDFDMPAFLRLGPTRSDHTMLEFNVFHAPPFDGAALDIGEYLRALNVAEVMSGTADLSCMETSDAYNRDQLGFPSQEYVYAWAGMSHAQPGYRFSYQVPPTLSFFS